MNVKKQPRLETLLWSFFFPLSGLWFFFPFTAANQSPLLPTSQPNLPPLCPPITHLLHAQSHVPIPLLSWSRKRKTYQTLQAQLHVYPINSDLS